jgi:hypothetical protein
MTHVHPDWCGQNHLCSVDGPAGEHRSYPVTVDGTAARLVLTRIRTRNGRDRAELRLVVDLPADPRHARQVTSLVVAGVHQAVSRAQLQARTR